MSKHKPPKRKRVAFLGESPNDTIALRELFARRYPDVFDFYIMIPHIRGSLLDDNTTKRQIEIEYRFHKPDYIIVARDLDDLETNRTKLRKMKANFRGVNKLLEGKGVFLLNIYEIEALILADIAAFNQHFKCEVEYDSDPMLQHDPKKVLVDFSKNCDQSYEEVECRKLFKSLDFDKLIHNCGYFGKFVKEFESLAKITA